MTTVFLAWSMSPNADNTLSQIEPTPPILVSYFYLKQYEKRKSAYEPTQTMLDSGAYSAWNSGADIDIEAYIDETKKKKWQESVALDVIGDGDKSLANALYMKGRGSPAFPVFHIGEKESLLKEYCAAFDKVGLSCRFGESVKTSMRWLGSCFKTAWPKKFHSFGWTSEEALLTYPFHTADSSSWHTGPDVYGRWKSFGQLSVRKAREKGVTWRVEVESYMKLQKRCETRWKKSLEAL